MAEGRGTLTFILFSRLYRDVFVIGSLPNTVEATLTTLLSTHFTRRMSEFFSVAAIQKPRFSFLSSFFADSGELCGIRFSQMVPVPLQPSDFRCIRSGKPVKRLSKKKENGRR